MEIQNGLQFREVLTPYSRRRSYIPNEIYAVIRKFIIEVLASEGEMTTNRLLERAVEIHFLAFGANLNWYVLKVKLDMEFRKEIKIMKGGPLGIPLLKLSSSRKIQSMVY
jgi:hypothetical protein